jgi:hypothetical protein
VIDEALLGRAHQASERLVLAERDATIARAEYHTAIRRMHLGGGTLREIAAALQLSHQRVQQIVHSAGGSWWGRVWRSRNARREAVCTFCGRPPSEVKKLVAGPNVYICDGCVSRAESVLSGTTRGGEALREVERRSRARCSFCGRRALDERLVVAGKDHGICRQCLGLSREIMQVDAGQAR